MNFRSIIDASQAFINRLNPQKFDTWQRVEQAFTYDGVTYYHFPDPTTMPVERYMTGLQFYTESSMNCDKEYLEVFSGLLDDILNSGDKVTTRVANAVQELKTRLAMAYVPDLVFKHASVLYFDKSENPYVYDWDYNRQKIEKWRENEADFFLQTQVRDLITVKDISRQDLQMYMTTAQKVDTMSRENIWEQLSMGKSKEDLENLSELRIKLGLA